jgi:hypothetical protein
VACFGEVSVSALPGGVQLRVQLGARGAGVRWCIGLNKIVHLVGLCLDGLGVRVWGVQLCVQLGARGALNEICIGSNFDRLGFGGEMYSEVSDSALPGGVQLCVQMFCL